ncbi:hypothetical protein [Maricaulis sp.]|uniref:hypothetical protein n=1 Tax=Maricaulis sp. TaxID=1486257 RepID=UPI003A90B64D
MTTVAIWLSKQNQSPSAMNIASDSRLSFGQHGTWDSGRKIFACQNTADVFGYAGDSTLGTSLLSQIASTVDYTNLRRMTATQKRQVCEKIMESASQGYFRHLHLDLKILHCFYDEEHGFVAWHSEFDSSTTIWTHVRLKLVDRLESDTALEIGAFGSGGKSFEERLWSRTGSPNGVRYSNTFFKALADVIDENDDPFSGGPIQMVSLGTRGVAKPAIFLRGQDHFLFGVKVDPSILMKDLECWNELGEFVDPVSGKLRSRATRRPG